MTTDEYKAKLDAFQAFLNGAKADPNPDVGHFAGQNRKLSIPTSDGFLKAWTGCRRRSKTTRRTGNRPKSSFLPGEDLRRQAPTEPSVSSTASTGAKHLGAV
jgi:hypothetical protein